MPGEMAPILWLLVSMPSRVLNLATGGRWPNTMCFQSLHRDAPSWLRIVGAAAEYFHRGHLAWTCYHLLD